MPKDAAGHLIPGRLSPTRAVPRVDPPARVRGPPRARSERRRRLCTRPRRSSGSAQPAASPRGRSRPSAAAIRPGVTTDELDAIAHDYVVAHGAYPSTLGYRGYPKSSCTSVNEVICHGIPDDTVLRGRRHRQHRHHRLPRRHARRPQPHVPRRARRAEEAALLVERTREALAPRHPAVAPGRQVNVIGRAIEAYAKRFGYGVVRDFTGHGVGRAFHSGLVIPHYDAAPAFDTVMELGMVFTIEPMLTLGTHRAGTIVGRRLDRRHPRPRAHRAVRAHPRGHRARRRDPDPPLSVARTTRDSWRHGD